MKRARPSATSSGAGVSPASSGTAKISQRFLLLRNKLCKCLILQHVTFVAKAPKMPGRVDTGFPLPSTGRGIEGEGWSYPEPPPVRFFLYPHHPASKLNT